VGSASGSKDRWGSAGMDYTIVSYIMCFLYVQNRSGQQKASDYAGANGIYGRYCIMHSEQHLYKMLTECKE
jgi:hypothetical protein